LEDISLTIDGKNITCRPGMTLLNAATENGFKIPTLCHHHHLKPAGACRLCLVEDEKSGRLMASCVTPVTPGMVVRTVSETIKKHRINIIRLMLANHPESCVVCSQGNRCELRKIAAELGVGALGLYPMPHYTGLEAANPFISRDLSKCILCGKCVRADHEMVMVGAIDYNLRGFKARPATAHDMPLENSTCTFCGTCVSICPTGALLANTHAYAGSPQEERPSICGFCGVGCSLSMGSVDGHVVEVNPSHQRGTVNRSTLCVRGHFVHDFLNASERLTRPLIRKNGQLSPASWDEAIAFVADRLMSIKKRNGPQSIGFLGSSKCTIEENYLFQKIARAIIGTNNVDNGSYLSGRPATSRIHERLMGGGRVAPLSGLEKAEAIFVLGANPTHSMPVVGYYLKKAARTEGIPMILVDPRKTELAPFSTLWLPIAPQTDADLINGLASILNARKADDTDFIVRFTEGFEEYREALASVDLHAVSCITGIDQDLMQRVADVIEGKKIAFVVGHGVLLQKFGFKSMDALLNLALMTGSLGGEGKGFYFLARENNEMGAWDMGAVPDFFPGRQPIQEEKYRRYWEQKWRVNLSPDPGLNMIRMVEEAGKGNIKALYIMGENPLRTLPENEEVKRALENLEFLVVQDILANETTVKADVILPGGAFSEKDGAFTNLEGRIQSFHAVVSPLGEAKPDWEILDLLAQKMGLWEPYKTIERLQEEVRSLVHAYSGTGASFDHSWIKETSPKGVFRPHGDGEPIRFAPVVAMQEQPKDEAYPMKAILGSARYHLGSGTRSGCSSRLKEFGLTGSVEIPFDAAKRMDLNDHDIVTISSRHGSITREVVLKKNMRQDVIFVPMAFNNNEARHLLQLNRLEKEDSPGREQVSVSIRKSEASS